MTARAIQSPPRGYVVAVVADAVGDSVDGDLVALVPMQHGQWVVGRPGPIDCAPLAQWTSFHTVEDALTGMGEHLDTLGGPGAWMTSPIPLPPSLILQPGFFEHATAAVLPAAVDAVCQAARVVDSEPLEFVGDEERVTLVLSVMADRPGLTTLTTISHMALRRSREEWLCPDHPGELMLLVEAEGATVRVQNCPHLAECVAIAPDVYVTFTGELLPPRRIVTACPTGTYFFDTDASVSISL